MIPTNIQYFSPAKPPPCQACERGSPKRKMTAWRIFGRSINSSRRALYWNRTRIQRSPLLCRPLRRTWIPVLSLSFPAQPLTPNYCHHHHHHHASTQVLHSSPSHDATLPPTNLTTFILCHQWRLHTKPSFIDIDIHIHMAKDKPDDGHIEQPASMERFDDGRVTAMERHEGQE